MPSLPQNAFRDHLIHLLCFARQQVANEQLIQDVPFCCSGPESEKHLGIETDEGQLPRLLPSFIVSSITRAPPVLSGMSYLTGCRTTISARESFESLHMWPKNTLARCSKKPSSKAVANAHLLLYYGMAGMDSNCAGGSGENTDHKQTRSYKALDSETLRRGSANRENPRRRS